LNTIALNSQSRVRKMEEVEVMRGFYVVLGVLNFGNCEYKISVRK
jgi:hypothetical protein